MMVDVHGVDLDATSLPREALQQPLLLTAEPKPTMIGTFDEFRERLDNFSGGLLKELSEIRGIVVAGGSVVGALMQVPAGDIDIFLQVPVENARTTLAEILKAIQRNQETTTKKRRLLVTRSKNALSFYRVGQSQLPPIQVAPP